MLHIHQNILKGHDRKTVVIYTVKQKKLHPFIFVNFWYTYIEVNFQQNFNITAHLFRLMGVSRLPCEI